MAQLLGVLLLLGCLGTAFDKYPNATVLFLVMSVITVIAVISINTREHNKKMEGMTTDEQVEYERKGKYGKLNTNLLCPHCQNRGSVRTMPVKRETRSLSGNLAKIETKHTRNVNQFHCDICEITWDV